MDPFIIIIGVVLLIAIVLLVVGLTGRPTGQDLVEDGWADARKKKKEEGEKGLSEIGVSAAVDRAVAGRGFAENLAIQISPG